jgi:predicted Zn-dependent protease
LFLGFYGFNGKAVSEGQSFVQVGERQFDPGFELIDDPLDERSLSLRFDAEGTPKRRVPLVSAGVSRNVVLDRREAAKAGTESTGHAITILGQNFGPVPTALFVSPGASTPEDLIAGVERGLYVSTFNYVRILDPRTTVATGLTRNGTFLIENGDLGHGVSDLRFTQSFAGAVADGRVLGVADDARFADSEFGPGIVHAPTMRLAGWRFTGGAAG